MLFSLSELAAAAREALPIAAGLFGAIYVALLHFKNRSLQKANFQLAQKVDDLANKDAEKNIESLESKVELDEKERIKAEAAALFPSDVRTVIYYPQDK